MDLPIRTSDQLARLIENVELPPISNIAGKLVATLSDDQVDLHYLRDLIAQDPALTASMLRWANSPIYGAARKVESLDIAISIMGLSKVKTRAIAFFLTTVLTPKLTVDGAAFGASCMRTADCAMWLAPLAKLDPNVAWLTGLMGRLGELVIATIDLASLNQIEERGSTALERWALERQHFGFDECDVMSEWAKTWFFPDNMVEALHKCARPTAFMEFSPLAALIHLASIVAENPEPHMTPVEALPLDVLSALGLSSEMMAEYFSTQALVLESADAFPRRQ